MDDPLKCPRQSGCKKSIKCPFDRQQSENERDKGECRSILKERARNILHEHLTM
jgi:hypothetical protein